METRNRLTATRGEEEADKRGKEKGLVKEQVKMTHGHGQQGGIDCGSGVWVYRAEEGNGKIGTTVIEQQ